MKFRPLPIVALSFAGAAALAAGSGTLSAAKPRDVANFPAPPATKTTPEGNQVAVLAGGCFWGVEAVFSHVKGVKSAVSGYHGGTERQADYKIVSSGITDHAEAVKITYDPKIIRYDQLLRIFFSVVADPTQLNRQGPDTGAQYRSAIVPTSAEQNAVAKAYIAQLTAAKLWSKPIVTRIERAQAFYPAESYHQDFMLKNPRHGYIVRWDAPKVKALKAMYPGVYSASFQRD